MSETGDLTLHLRRVVPAPRTQVFEACTSSRELPHWWGPHGFTTPQIDLDLHVGGSYRFAMQPPDGEVFHLSGEFLAIDPPARLAYTFRWEEPDPDDRETAVNLSFRDMEGSTEVALVQSGFATEERRALHEAGWTDSLDRLQDLMSSRGSAGG